MINTKEKVSIFDGIKSINYVAIILCVFSFFMGRICLFDAFYCVGIAYVGVMCQSKEIRRWSVVLAVLGLISTGTFSLNIMKYVLVILLIAILRGTMAFFKYQCNLRNQMVIVGVSLLMMNIMAYFIQGITVYKLIVSILEVASTVGIMSVLYIATKLLYNRKTESVSEYEMVSIGFLIACLLCGVIDFYVTVPVFGHVYFRDVLIFVVIIGSIYLGGISTGTVMSIIVSSVLVVIGYIPPAFVTIYVFAALVGSLFNHLERIGIIFATTLGLLLGFALFNNRVIDMAIMGAYIGGATLSLLIPRHYFGIANWSTKEEVKEKDYHMHDINGIITDQLKKFSSAFAGLGRQFQNIHCEHFNLEVKEMNELIENAGESMCQDCAMRNFCWDDYIQQTYRSCYKMLRTLDKQCVIKAGDIPPEFKKACINAESFAYTLGTALDLYKNDCKWQENFNESRKMIAQQFKGVADSISGFAKHVENSFTFDEEMETKIKRNLHKKGIVANDIMVLKKDGKQYVVHIYCTYKGQGNYKEIVLKCVEETLNERLEITKYEYDLEDESCYFEFGLKRQYMINCSMRYNAKEEVSGDVYSYLDLNNGQYLIALADGMGSGKEARRESEMTIDLLERFLEAGFNSEVAIRLINSALVLKSEVECSSTLDMILIDQYTGVAQFCKAGASTSFILRDGEIIPVKANSLPIGILSNVDVVSYKKQLKDNDILIMVTDGMLEDRCEISNREATFKHFIQEARTNNTEHLAQFLMNKTKTLLAGIQNDDMTIVVARVKETIGR